MHKKGSRLTPAGRKRISKAKKEWWRKRKQAKLEAAKAAEDFKYRMEVQGFPGVGKRTMATTTTSNEDTTIIAAVQPHPATLCGYLDSITENAALIIEDCKAIRKLMG